jgi:hypothetical protein
VAVRGDGGDYCFDSLQVEIMVTGYEMLFGIGWLGVVAVGYGVLVVLLAWLDSWASQRKRQLRKTDRL